MEKQNEIKKVSETKIKKDEKELEIQRQKALEKSKQIQDDCDKCLKLLQTEIEKIKRKILEYKNNEKEVQNSDDILVEVKENKVNIEEKVSLKENKIKEEKINQDIKVSKEETEKVPNKEIKEIKETKNRNIQDILAEQIKKLQAEANKQNKAEEWEVVKFDNTPKPRYQGNRPYNQTQRGTRVGISSLEAANAITINQQDSQKQQKKKNF